MSSRAVLALKIVNLIALLLTVAWFARSPDWEPAVGFLGLLATLIGLEVKTKSAKGPHPDKELFQEFLRVLPSNDSIEFIRTFNMAGFSFDRRKLDDLKEFAYEWDDAEHEFHDKQLETKRKKLLKLIQKYLNYIAMHTFHTEYRYLYSVPLEWEYQKPELFNQIVGDLHRFAEEIVSTHQDLVRTGRRKLRL